MAYPEDLIEQAQHRRSENPSDPSKLAFAAPSLVILLSVPSLDLGNRQELEAPSGKIDACPDV
jgi:hypothetical protein